MEQVQNRVVRVRLSGGLIGAISSNSRTALENTMSDANAQGWRCVQVLPEGQQNIFMWLASLFVLCCTLCLWTFSPGFLVVLERR
jgi:hypothetical protein